MNLEISRCEAQIKRGARGRERREGERRRRLADPGFKMADVLMADLLEIRVLQSDRPFRRTFFGLVLISRAKMICKECTLRMEDLLNTLELNIIWHF